MNGSTRKLLDLWMPPEGAGRPLGCLATTFTFDADFFEQQCAGRFLGLDARPGEGDELSFLIEREEKLAETPVAVLADRSLNPDARSLRWDVLTVAVRTGVMHAKVSVLVWSRAVRLIVSSANLVEASYRTNIELAVAFDAGPACELPRSVFEDLLGAVERIARMAPGTDATVGPRQRALSIVARARARIDSFDLPQRPRRGDPRVVIVAPSGGRDAFDGLLEAWASGGPPLHASIMSPFFDAGQTPSRAAARLVDVLAKRGASVDLVIPVEQLEDRTVARVPRALVDALPGRIQRRLVDVRQPEPSEVRRLHGKSVLLENREWVAALIGSPNFTVPGLGVGGAGNLEVGVAIGARTGSAEAAVLQGLILDGDDIGLAVEFDAEQDPEEHATPVPAGFVQVLGRPELPASLVIELDPAGLPADWQMATPDGLPLLTADAWREAGGSPAMTIPAPGDALPFNVAVRWRGASGAELTASLPVNVIDPAALPPPEELRSLPIEAVLRALASTRPLHEALAGAVERVRAAAGQTDVDLDPLKRFSPAGQLLHRTRELSAALTGLRQRLERPAVTIDAFRWRVEGPFGPLAIAAGLIEQRPAGRSIPGEEAFLVAEIALTLADTDVESATRFIPRHRHEARAAIQGAVANLRDLSDAVEGAPDLRAYVEEAFARATA